jgi:glycosyltransferase involved in cell wall biosynthesis
MASERVSILVVTYNHRDEIDACLDAALAQRSPDLEVEVVVADNASSDGTEEHVGERPEPVRLLAMGANRGFAAGMNAAFAASTGEWVLFLNPDCGVLRGDLVRERLERLAGVRVEPGEQVGEPDEIAKALGEGHSAAILPYGPGAPSMPIAGQKAARRETRKPSG